MDNAITIYILECNLGKVKVTYDNGYCMVCVWQIIGKSYMRLIPQREWTDFYNQEKIWEPILEPEIHFKKILKLVEIG